jgi:hypothetical protein
VPPRVQKNTTWASQAASFAIETSSKKFQQQQQQQQQQQYVPF